MSVEICDSPVVVTVMVASEAARSSRAHACSSFSTHTHTSECVSACTLCKLFSIRQLTTQAQTQRCDVYIKSAYCFVACTHAVVKCVCAAYTATERTASASICATMRTARAGVEQCIMVVNSEMLCCKASAVNVMVQTA
jgi:hypothetical protein